MRTEPSEFEHIDRRNYELSETQPLRVVAKCHPVVTSLRFDMHYALELGVVQRGRMERVYHGHRRSLTAGGVWMCGCWEPHGFQVTEGPCEAVVVNIFPAMLATTFPELHPADWQGPFLLAPMQRPSVEDSERPLILTLARELVASLRISEPRRRVVQRMLVYQILMTLPRVTVAPSAQMIADHDRINRAIELVFKHQRYVSCMEAARHCGLGEGSFRRLFIRIVGISFPAFSMRYRLQGAASELLETAAPIKAIAQNWGFVDTSHFHASFQPVYGCSPARYRSGLALDGREEAASHW